MERKIIACIDKYRQEIINFAEDIYRHPEGGFCEFRTASKVREFLEKLGLDVRAGMGRTGVCGTFSTGPGPHVTVIGELDGILCPGHPFADSETGIAHACGHHLQLALMLGAALALTDAEVRRHLEGTVSFLAVPAEEYVDAQKRRQLEQEGVGFAGTGKAELIRLGVFADTDIALTTHVHMVPVEEDFYLGNPASNGFSSELVTVKGRAAHAAVAPWEGVNALSIASSALNMMGLMRETFREEDHVRLHTLIREGGEALNSVPERVIVESKVRAGSLDAIDSVREKAARAFEGAAYAFGGRIEREKLQGYLPVRYRPADRALELAAEYLEGYTYRNVSQHDFNNACTDMGDLTHMMPVVNFTFGGFCGVLHGAEFSVTDWDKALIAPAKLAALTVYELLKDHAEQARQVMGDYQAVFSQDEYIKRIQKMIYNR